ncbi:MAG: extracellular solute-binding protein [Tissierellia bacterium]|nr:extracellular solute-binding protein [Tissierellia bacterium]
MNKKLKSLLALMLALVLVLAACGGDKPNTETPTTGEEEKPTEGETTETPAAKLKGEISVQAEEPWVAYYQKAIDKIVAENPDAKINIKTVGSFDHIGVIESTDATNQDVADVFALPADRFTGFADNDILAALDAQAMARELGGFADYDAGLGGNLKVGDDYLAFPFNIETLVTFVNTKNAEAAGTDHTKPYELTEQKDAATVLLPLFDAWFGVAPNNAGGIELLAKDDDGKFVSTYAAPYDGLTADQKAVFDAIYGYWKLNKDAATTLFDAEAGWGYIDHEFTAGGKGQIRLEGPWATSGDGIIAKEVAAGNVAVYPIGHITIGGKPLTHWQGGWTLAVNSRIEEDADKMALATALIKELVNPANAVELYKATGKILENVTVDVYEASDLTDVDKSVIKNVLESYKVSPPRPLFKEYGQVWDTWKNAVLSWNSVNPADPAAAYEQLNASFTSMMQQIGQ